MLKIVIFDSGYGGEFFADRLEETFPIVEVIRVINWREAEKILMSPRTAREVAEESLRPYIGKVDLIIFANYLLGITSVKYFQQKFKNQKFLGLTLKSPDTFIKRDVLLLSTKAVSKTIAYRNFVFRLKRNTRTINLDSWPAKIDDGELSTTEIRQTLELFLMKHPSFCPKEIILASSQFDDIKKELKAFFGQSLPIYDGFDDTIRDASKILKIRGRVGEKKG